jgi:hypothetical protein
MIISSESKQFLFVTDPFKCRTGAPPGMRQSKEYNRPDGRSIQNTWAEANISSHALYGRAFIWDNVVSIISEATL